MREGGHLHRRTPGSLKLTRGQELLDQEDAPIERHEKQRELNELGSEREGILDALADPVLVLDKDGAVLFANGAGIRYFGLDESPEGRKFGWPLTGDGEVDVDVISGGVPSRIAAMHAREIVWDGEKAFVASFRDVTVARQNERDLARGEARFRATFEGASVGLAVTDLSGAAITVNDALCAMTGYSRNELVGEKIPMLFEQAARELEAERTAEVVAGKVGHHSFESPIPRRGSDEFRIAQVQVTRADADHPDVEPMLIYQLSDISDRHHREAQLRHGSDHDALTGLLNREAFVRELDRRIEECRRYGIESGLLKLDLDGLKRINDRHGHDEGNRVLESVAAGLKSRLRASDLVARLGDDEFVVLAPRIAPGDLGPLASSLLAAIRSITLDEGGGDELALEASAGGCVVGPGTEDPAAALRTADAALYEAKAAGGNRFVSAPRTSR